MGLIKFLWSLFCYPQHHEFTPAPDDWPPDGSLHFLKCIEEAQTRVPSTHVRYEFSANVGEEEDGIGLLSMALMKRFCGSRQVLTRIFSSGETSKKEKHPPERFTVQYRRFLEHISSPVSIHAPDEQTLFLLDQGFDPAVFWANRDIAATDYCFLDAYVLPETFAENAKNAAAAVATGTYDVWFCFSDWGPCALYVTLNPQTVDATALQQLIEQVCAENGILFQNPHMPS